MGSGLDSGTCSLGSSLGQERCFVLSSPPKINFFSYMYTQIDSVTMGSPLGPLMANTFMCSIDEKLAHDNKLHSLYERYVDDTFALVPDLTAATNFLSVKLI